MHLPSQQGPGAPAVPDLKAVFAKERLILVRRADGSHECVGLYFRGRLLICGRLSVPVCCSWVTSAQAVWAESSLDEQQRTPLIPVVSQARFSSRDVLNEFCFTVCSWIQYGDDQDLERFFVDVVGVSRDAQPTEYAKQW